MGFLGKLFGLKHFNSFMGIEFDAKPAEDQRFKPVPGMEDEYLFTPPDGEDFGFKINSVTVTPFSHRIACIGSVESFGTEASASEFFEEVRRHLIVKYSEFGAMKSLPELPGGAIGWIIKVYPGEYRNLVLLRSTPTNVNLMAMDCLNNDIRKEEVRTGKAFDAH